MKGDKGSTEDPGSGRIAAAEQPQGETTAPAGLRPEALFAGATTLDERQTLQWLGHLQRLASTGLLAGGMAHDLAGILQPLMMESERALLDEDPLSHRQALVRMREWARRGSDYVRALLNLVRRDEAYRVPVPVESVVEDTLSLLSSTKRLAGVSVTRKLDNCHVALVDRTRLMQAVLNLVTNAVRAARSGGNQVTVGVRGWRDWIVVEIEDDGPGVPPEIGERIFQPFVQAPGMRADGEAERTPTGTSEKQDPLGAGRTGLGLYITKRLIEEQGGRIGFDTEVGVGTVFRLMLEPAPVDEASTGRFKGNAPSRGGHPSRGTRGEQPR